MKSKAVLLSGGFDSTAVAAIEQPNFGVFVNYGQRPALAELTASKVVAEELGIEFMEVIADCSSVGSGDLAGKPALALSPSREWWPYRNQLIATLAAGRLVSTGIEEIVFGTVSTDEFHADGTRSFFEKLSELMQLQEGGIRVSAPYIGLTTVDLVRKSHLDDEILGWCFSCHVGNYACGHCRGCHKRESVLKELGRLQ